MTKKRSRGRPKGTAINDARHIEAVADVMVRNPDLKKTPAISQIVQKAFPQHQWQAAERRILRKWNETARERLEEARERRDEHYQASKEQAKRAHAVSRSLTLKQSPSVSEAIKAATSFQDRIEGIFDIPGLRAIQEQAEQMRRLQDLIDPPVLRRLREQTEMMQKAFRGF